jgi:hypothetical protein
MALAMKTHREAAKRVEFYTLAMLASLPAMPVMLYLLRRYPR